MSKKAIIYLLAAVILTGICFIPFNHRQTVHIQASFLNTFQQTSKPDNWKKWQPELMAAMKQKQNPNAIKIINTTSGFSISAGNTQLNVHKIDGLSYAVDKLIAGKSSSYTFLPIPDTHNDSSLVIVSQKINLIHFLFDTFKSTPAGADMLQLKSYMEDAYRYYGFDIRRGTVIDSNVVVEKRVVAARNKQAAVAQVQQELHAFILQHHLRMVQPIIADIRQSGNDSVRLMIGLPVNERITSVGNIQFMHLPRRGHMLSGIYIGLYSGREKLYSAMRSYMTDYNLASPEDPYEKYLDNKIPASDTSYVHLQVNFPIY